LRDLTDKLGHALFSSQGMFHCSLFNLETFLCSPFDQSSLVFSLLQRPHQSPRALAGIWPLQREAYREFFGRREEKKLRQQNDNNRFPLLSLSTNCCCLPPPIPHPALKFNLLANNR
jgi:hypothetical protein